MTTFTPKTSQGDESRWYAVGFLGACIICATGFASFVTFYEFQTISAVATIIFLIGLFVIVAVKTKKD